MSVEAANEVEIDGVRVVISMDDEEGDGTGGRVVSQQPVGMSESQVDVEVEGDPSREEAKDGEDEEDLLDYDNIEDPSSDDNHNEIRNNNNDDINVNVDEQNNIGGNGFTTGGGEGVTDMYGTESTNQNDLDHPHSRQFLEEQAQEVAKQLLREEAPKIVVKYRAEKFLLFFFTDKDNSSAASYPVICEDTDLLHAPCADVMARLRHFLENLYGKLEFATKEILLKIPVLDLEICEDNVFNSQVTIRDIQTIFHILRDRSLRANETDVPDYIEAEIGFRLRFVSRFNALVELTEGSATLANILPFSNNEDNPVVLDDPVTPDSEPEVIVMDVDDSKPEDTLDNTADVEEVHQDESDVEIDLDDEGNLDPQQAPQANNPTSAGGDVPMDIQGKENSDSDELLEIDSDDGVEESAAAQVV